MFDYQTDELSEEENDRLIQKAAEEIIKRKMEVPAVLMLEMHKPLSFVASQASIVFAPFIIPAVGFERAQNITRLLARRGNVELLIQKIEALAESAKAKKGAAIGSTVS